MFDLRLKQKKRLLESGGPSCENIKKPKTSAKVHPGQGNSCGRELCVCGGSSFVLLLTAGPLDSVETQPCDIMAVSAPDASSIDPVPVSGSDAPTKLRDIKRRKKQPPSDPPSTPSSSSKGERVAFTPEEEVRNT